MKIIPHEKFDGIYWIIDKEEKNLATKNLAKKIRVYGEKIFEYEGEEYREWIPYRSKLAAAILNGLNNLPIKKGARVLYLGIATGTTSSHISDIIGENGILYGIDIAPKVLIQFEKNVAKYRKNVIPILSDARKPSLYEHFVGEVDFIYCDIAQPKQAEPLSENAYAMLKKDGWIMIAIKARSIDSIEIPAKIFKKEKEVLIKNGFEIIEEINLEPYEKDHVMLLGKFLGK